MSDYCQPADVHNLFFATNAAVSDTIIKRLITLASAYVENFTRRIFTQQAYTESTPLRINRDGEIVCRVRQWPIVVVSALSWSLRTNNTPIALDLNFVDIDRPPARFFYWAGASPFTGTAFPNRYGPPSVLNYTYTAGYNPIPDDIRLATALICQAFIMFDINPAGATSISVSSAAGSSNSLSFGKRSIHLDTAEMLLGPYVAKE